MKILIINGVNLNMLGVREPNLYGNSTYKDLEKFIKSNAKKLNVKVDIFQSNYEGEIVDKIQLAYNRYDGIIINAGAYSHTSIAILDALKAVNVKTVEVHLTDVSKREEFRHFSYISLFAQKTIYGKGFDGYVEAMKEFIC